jgi:hypothetical protein
MEKINQVVVGGSFKILKSMQVTVKYDCPVSEGLRTGGFEWSNSDITDDNFPATAKEVTEVEICLIHFDQDIATDEVLSVLEMNGLRPAEIIELLSIGRQYPLLQTECTLVALGSVWQGSAAKSYVPYLGCSSKRRGVGLFATRKKWLAEEFYALAAVRKDQSDLC